VWLKKPLGNVRWAIQFGSLGAQGGPEVRMSRGIVDFGSTSPTVGASEGPTIMRSA